MIQHFLHRKCSAKNLVLAIYYLLRYSPRLPFTIGSHIRPLLNHYYFQIPLQVWFYYFCKLPLRWTLLYFVLARCRHVRCLISWWASCTFFFNCLRKQFDKPVFVEYFFNIVFLRKWPTRMLTFTCSIFYKPKLCNERSINDSMLETNRPFA